MLQCLNTDESRELRSFLLDSGYNMQALLQCFGHDEAPQIHLLKLFTVGLTLLPNRLHTLLRWFWIGAAVDASTTHEFVPDRILDLFLKSGLLAAEDAQFTSAYRISPFSNYLIVSDQLAARSGTLRTDMVVWPNPTSQLCHYLSMQAPVERALDLGSGSGVLAVPLAAHSGSVVATDVNPRAREFCLFNAALNGSSNVEFREGSLFEPVQGERFDLILANPPFFVTPTMRHSYSDNGMELDGFCRTLVRQAPEHLNDKGYFQMVVEWVEFNGQPWRDRLKEWFSGIGCDAWVICSYSRSSVDYALIRMQDDHSESLEQAAQIELLKSWREYFESRQVKALYGGVIVLRRREGPNWVRMEELHALLSRPFGECMRQIFESRDYLGAHSDEDLANIRPASPPTTRLTKQFAMSPEGWQLAAIDMHLGEGLPYSVSLQPQVADFLAFCDGKRTVREIADQIAAAHGIDAAIVRHESCGIVRRLADRGMIVV